MSNKFIARSSSARSRGTADREHIVPLMAILPLCDTRSQWEEVNDGLRLADQLLACLAFVQYIIKLGVMAKSTGS